MDVHTAGTDRVEDLTDCWVALAREQRQYDSHLRADANRASIRESMVRHAVADRALVAVEDGDVLGFVTFDVETGHYEQDVERGIVEHLFVVPDRREEGIGTRLLSAAETALADRGVDVVALDAMADNEAARRFYRRHGYEPHRVTIEKSIESDTHSKENT
ncbi:MAG: N-acetyltransferase family protein [Haloarculaceae archaeon]